ncbi:LolA family protein [Virgibacillus oceani]|uniref:Sporulation protein YdcC n=1 Tax=Virgibacillus oceani TaxID=1479511 RepID=A0A917HQR3_9BACI|nr:outer membrane lipoprotein carrier protein LolA [Virgibacillus oceani]GGG87633.1 sporulation protein YdcC [Virgibacillus oceani]
MKKTFGIWIAIAFGLILLLAACGEKSQEDVVKKLEDKLENMNGYKAAAEMKMNTGPESLKYQLDIWHKKKDFYRVALKNNQDEKGNQIILKNEDGVFVLTPALNKSFKFQRDWPEKTSQPYLFQSLVQDIVKDNEATFKVTDAAYVFQTKTNYQSNNNLPYQEIHIDKKSYTPKLVKVLDKDKNALVEVKFNNFDTNPSFKGDDFALEKNMTSGATETSASANETVDPFTVVLPTETTGSELAEKKEVDLENGQRVVMTYEGEKNFTLIEEKKEVVPTLSSPQEVTGEIVNLGHTIGAISDNSI